MRPAGGNAAGSEDPDQSSPASVASNESSGGSMERKVTAGDAGASARRMERHLVLDAKHLRELKQAKEQRARRQAWLQSRMSDC